PALKHPFSQVSIGDKLHNKVIESAILAFGLEDAHHRGMHQLHHRVRAAEESLAAEWIAGEIQVQYLDCDALLLRTVKCLPDHGEAAPTHDPHEKIATVAQGVPSTELSSFAELSPKFKNLAVEVISFDARVAQPFLPRTGILEPL